jgi:tetratricopeptide (TPR) repeat protein
MTAINRKLFPRRGSARHFLFSKTDTGRLKQVSRQECDAVNQVLHSAYPDILLDQDFIDQALREMDTAARFAAMVIRPDQNRLQDEDTDGPVAGDGQIETAAILDAVCRREKGLWGGLESGLLGGFFPDKNGTQALELAHKVQKRLKEKNAETVTVGVAAYPTVTYLKADILENARKALDHATFFGPDSAVAFDAVSLNISGDKLYEKGEIPAAIQELTMALTLDPSNVNVHNSLGVCYGLLSDYEPAIAEFKAAVSLEPEEYMALYNLGLVYLLTDRRDQALELFLKADSINGETYEVTFQTGKLYLESGDPAKAQAFLERAAALEPKSRTVYRYLGDCYAANNMQAEAIAAYRKAIKLNPQDAASMSALGCLFDEQGENPEITLVFCRESVGLAPESGLFRYRLGRLYFNLDRFDDALREFKKAEQLGYDASEDIKTIEDRLGKIAS